MVDLVTAESVSRDIVEQALADGQRRGLISVGEVTELL
jgi:hypothetical protein